MQLHDGNTADNWRNFKTEWKYFALVTDAYSKTKRQKAALFLNIIGLEAQKLIETLGIPQVDINDVDRLLKILDETFLPQANIHFERSKYMAAYQKPGQSYDSFYQDLRKITDTCEFGSMTDEMILAKLICSIQDNKMKENKQILY